MKRRNNEVVKAVIAFVSFLSILTLMLISLPTMLFDAELDFVEGFMLYNGINLLRGLAYHEGIYVYPYPPLPYLSSALSYFIMQDHPIVGCRLLALIASLAILLLAWIEAGGGIRGLIAPSLIAISPSFIYWAALCRADQLGVLLSLLSVALALRGSLLSSAACAALALFSKQTYISAPLMLMAHMLLRGERRSAIRYATYLAIITTMLYLPFLALTNGGMLLHLTLYNIHDLMITNLINLVLEAFANGFWAIYLPLLALSLYRAKEDPYALYYALSLLLALFFSLKVGAHTNYFIEPTAIGGILLARELSRSRREWISALLCLFIVTSLALHPPTFLLDRVGDPDLVVETRAIASMLSGFDEILTEDAYLAVLSGSRILAEPFIYNQLVARGLMDDVLPKMVREGVIDAIAIRWGDPTRITSEIKALSVIYYNCSETRYFTVCVSPRVGLQLIESGSTDALFSIISLQQAILAYSRFILLVLSWICFAALFTLSLMLAWWWRICGNSDNSAGQKALQTRLRESG